MSPNTLYRYVNEQKIPAFMLANRWRFKKSMLDEWMVRESGFTPSLAPVQRMRPTVQEKIAACYSIEVERALEVAFRKLQADERVREEELREAIRRAGSSPLGGLEPLAFRRSKS